MYTSYIPSVHCDINIYIYLHIYFCCSICIHVHTYIYTYIYLHMYIYVYIYIYIYRPDCWHIHYTICHFVISVFRFVVLVECNASCYGE